MMKAEDATLLSTSTDSVLRRNDRKKKITETKKTGGNVAPGGRQWPSGAVTPQQHIDRLTDVCSLCARVPF